MSSFVPLFQRKTHPPLHTLEQIIPSSSTTLQSSAQLLSSESSLLTQKVFNKSLESICAICQKQETLETDPNKMYGFLRFTCCKRVAHFSCSKNEVLECEGDPSCKNCHTTLDPYIFNCVTKADTEKIRIIHSIICNDRTEDKEYITTIRERVFKVEEFTHEIWQQFPIAIHSAVYYAAQRNDPTSLKSLIRQGFPANGVVSEKNFFVCPLFEATTHKNKPLVSFLLKHGANPDGTLRYRPLIEACSNLDTEIVSLLQKHNGDLQLQNEDGASPLLALLEAKGEIESLECPQEVLDLEDKIMLLELPNFLIHPETIAKVVNYKGSNTSLINSSAKGSHFEFFTALFKKHKPEIPLLTIDSITQSPDKKKSSTKENYFELALPKRLPHPIFSSILSNGPENFLFLTTQYNPEILEQIVYLNDQNKVITIAMELLSQICNYCTEKFAHKAFFQKLLALYHTGISFDVQNNFGETALNFLAQQIKDDNDGGLAIASLQELVHWKADPFIPDRDGNLPLHHYCLNMKSTGKKDVMDLLFDSELLNRPDILKNKNGETPLDILLKINEAIENGRSTFLIGSEEHKNVLTKIKQLISYEIPHSYPCDQSYKLFSKDQWCVHLHQKIDPNSIFFSMLNRSSQTTSQSDVKETSE